MEARVAYTNTPNEIKVSAIDEAQLALLQAQTRRCQASSNLNQINYAGYGERSTDTILQEPTGQEHPEKFPI